MNANATDLVLHRLARALEDISDCLQHHPEAHELLMRALSIDTVPLEELSRQWGVSRAVIRNLASRDPTFPRPVEVTRGRRVVHVASVRRWLAEHPSAAAPGRAAQLSASLRSGSGDS